MLDLGITEIAGVEEDGGEAVHSVVYAGTRREGSMQIHWENPTERIRNIDRIIKREDMLTDASVTGCSTRTTNGTYLRSEGGLSGSNGVGLFELSSACITNISRMTSWRISIGVLVPGSVDGRIVSSDGNLLRYENWSAKTILVVFRKHRRQSRSYVQGPA